LDKDQEVETTKGVKKISDITEQDRLISVYSADSYESFAPKAVSTLGAVCTGYKDVYEFRVNNRAIRATEDHPVITLDGDTIPIKEAFDKKIPLMPISQVKSNLDFDVDAFMVAVIGADFCLTEAAKYPCFCQSEVRPLPTWLIANTHPNTKSVSKGSIFLRYTDHPVATLARDVYGVCESKNKNPQFELKDINAASSFVFGLLATDVSVRNNPKGSQIIFGSVSKHLNDFIGVALTFAGIPYYKSKKHDRYVCTISSAAGINRIYHILEQYKGILDLGLTLPKPTDTQHKIYITSCEHVGKSEVYDLTVPNVHTYCVNGFVVHNCEGSARTMPLRERPLDVSLKAFDDVHKETGCFDTTPYGFNLSDHSNIRAMLNYLAKDQDVKIQMSSQRIDMFTEDFASLAYATGNRSVTLAIEGGSERMRRAVNKNLTTQQILEAFEIALKIGFNRVKIYMIANLPFERSEDIDGTPSQLVSTEYEGAVKYHEEDAVYLTFEDNTSLLVSKNYVFYKKLGETTADQLQTGDEVYVDETLKKVKATERREADLYGPEKNEEDSLVGLMKKLAARRDYWKQQHGGKETVLNWSFTPFTSKNSTPFQFASCMGGLTNRKTLTPAVEAARQLGFKFRVGTAADVSTVAQVMTLGDRRLNNVIYRAYKEGIIQYFGGMGIGKDVLPAFENLLKEEVGHTYDVYGGEKMLHQIFPWDFIDVGMDKTHLKERYLQAKAATNSPFSCFNRCVSCGGCMVSQENLPQDAYMDVEKQFETI
jgi:intein/homing endonuclease